MESLCEAPRRGFQLDCVEILVSRHSTTWLAKNSQNPPKDKQRRTYRQGGRAPKGLQLAWVWTTGVRRLWLEAQVLVMDNFAGCLEKTAIMRNELISSAHLSTLV